MSIYLDTPRVLKQLLVAFHKVQHVRSLFFLLYTNDLLTDFSVAHSFADDTNFVFPSKETWYN